MGLVFYPEAPWGVVYRADGAWRGCPGSPEVSRCAAESLAAAAPQPWEARRNPADVLAEELETMTPEEIFGRAEHE